MKNKKKPEETQINHTLLIVAAFVVCAWLFTFIVGGNAVSESRGTFGDMFGAVNALFSGLAFCGVVYAILLQRLELRLTREELELTRKEIRGQKSALEEQATALTTQVFETSFFSRLENLRSIVSSYSMPNGNKPNITGVNVFKKKISNIDYSLSLIQAKTITNAKDWFTINTKMDSNIRVYISCLEDIFRFIEATNIKQKKSYFRTISAQMSDEQKLFVFLFCACNDQAKLVNVCIEKYGLFHDLPLEKMHEVYGKMRDLYNDNAYRN